MCQNPTATCCGHYKGSGEKSEQGEESSEIGHNYKKFKEKCFGEIIGGKVRGQGGRQGPLPFTALFFSFYSSGKGMSTHLTC